MSSKKTSKAPVAENKYNLRDVVLAKVRGYPPWPAMIVDPDKVSKTVKKEKPISKKTTFYCVRFFPAGDHSWAVAKDLSRLLPHEIEAYISEPSKKNGDLKRGYEIALDPTSWEEEHDQKQADAEAAEEEMEEGVDQLEDSDGGEEEMEADGDGSSKKKKSTAGKKRKREIATAEDQKKKRKNNQEALSAKRRPIAGSKKVKGKGSSTDNVESEDGEKAVDEDDDSGEKKAPTRKGAKGKATAGEDRPSKKSKKDKEEAEDAEDANLVNDPEAQRVKEWRHKLQRAFLTAKNPPQPDDMPGYDQIFSTVENYDKLNIEYLQFSKIGKVMRRIAGMENIPRDDEFHFKERATTLVATWQSIIQAAEADAEGKGNASGAKTAATAKVNTDVKAAVNGKANGAQDTEMTNGDSKETTVAETVKTNGVTEKKGEAKQDEEAMDMSDS
ncbi:hypothetical protein FRB94_011856 [Tulasnella sp. JGI-2019a]|nr:hypothetical protein FRB94_011856 [Tulasnella sp. JGI-2019a]KAG9014457.1 hypothetical protein FRB93_013582 [Tulasnella sp. JGI-2019a]KAG9039714.1 hypothetical protein FRB95_007141 [Tulasnella sp. JGI-2019a]